MPIEIGTYRARGGRSTRRRLIAMAPVASRLVAEHTGNRPLAPVHIVAVRPAGLRELFITTLAHTAGLLPSAPWDEIAQLLPGKPGRVDQIYSVTIPRPARTGGGTLTLVNARRHRRRGDYAVTLLTELAAVDQLLLRSVRARWIDAVRHVTGAHTIPKGRFAGLLRDVQEDAAAADQVAQELYPELMRRT